MPYCQPPGLAKEGRLEHDSRLYAAGDNDEAELGLANSADDLPKLYGAFACQRG